MPMRQDWIDALFLRLHATYGAHFLKAYDGVAPEAVKAVWAEELDGVGSGGIAHALKHLPPEWPPTAMAFRALCMGYAPTAARALPSAPASAAKVARVMAKVSRATQDPRAWMARLEARIASGERLGRAQLDMLARGRGTSSIRTAEPSNGAGSSVGAPESLPISLPEVSK